MELGRNRRKGKNEKRDGKERGSREGLINPGCGPD